MKKLLIGILAILAVCLGLEAWAKKLDNSGVSANNKNLIIYNWGDYIDPKLIKKFEKQTGYHVIYETFDSNEAMYTKVKQGGTAYDICVPSDYMISKMRKAKLLDKIDTKKIPNYKNIGSEFLHHSFDPKNTYSVPYFWGTLGIVYNDKFVKPGQIKHWNDLWSKDYRHNILLVDSARDIMGLSLASMGKSLNTTNSLDLKLAKTKLDGLGPNVKAIISDELKMYMIQNEAAVGVTWSGEARTMLMIINIYIMWFHQKVQTCGLIILLFPVLLKIKQGHMLLLISCLIQKMLLKMPSILVMQRQISKLKNYYLKR